MIVIGIDRDWHGGEKMLNEVEKKKHRCCFTGHRAEKLAQPEDEVKGWLRRQIEQAVSDGYTTFVTGMAMGVDIWAGQIVAEMKFHDPSLHLIAAVPWHGFSSRWHTEWRQHYDDLLAQCDLVRYISDKYTITVFQDRNEWMINHSAKLIAYYNGESGGTENTIAYAQELGGIDIVIGGITA